MYIQVLYAAWGEVNGICLRKERKMNLQAARNLLMRDRLDWRKPHLRWINDTYYRLFRSTHPR